eukprot:gb/GECH01000691.1/.p1 GENE.gb/GECH01000691.1/~~gb/GECH01000691.1/.p1  ORF type:complete len:893 (+),score=200.11 gb/GECH01000691.1/:1-2679(+)
MEHKAFHSTKLLSQNLSLKIESLATWDDVLVAGTSSGQLLRYNIMKRVDGEEDSRTTYSLENMSVKRDFLRKSVLQLCPVITKDVRLLLTLSGDGYVYIHSLDDLKPTREKYVPKVKGCLTFAVKKHYDQIQLCCALKKKLVLLQYNTARGSFEYVKDLFSPERARSVSWSGDKLCVGYSKEYTLISTDDGNLKELFPTGRSQSPASVVIPSNSEVVLARDTVGVAVDYDGKPTLYTGCALNWSETPQRLAFVYPYIIGVMDSYVEIKAWRRDSNVGKRFSQISDALTQTFHLPDIRAHSSSNFVDFDQDVVLFAGATSGAIFLASSNNLYALSLLPFEEQVEQLKRNNRHEESLYVCRLVEDTPLQLTSWRVDSIIMSYAFSLFSERKYQDAMERFEETTADPRMIILLCPGLMSSKSNYSIPLPIDTQHIINDPQERKKAIEAMISFLASRRKTVDDMDSLTADEQDIQDCVDTALLKAYLLCREHLVETFLKRKTYCNLDDAEAALKTSEKYKELKLLYQMRGLHRKALDLLKTMGMNDEEPLAGVSHTVKYLQDLGPEHSDLIIEYSEWVLKHDANQGLEIFTSQNCQLDVSRVLEHLKKLGGIKGLELRISYLQQVIAMREEDHEDLNNHLISLYLKFVIREKDESKKRDMRVKLLEFLNSERKYNAGKMLTKFPTEDLYEEQAILLSRINSHEKALSIYVDKIESPERAEQYCMEQVNKNASDAEETFIALLRIYLEPLEAEGYVEQSGVDAEVEEERLKAAITLLERHFNHIDTARALELLPRSVPVQRLQQFLEAVLRANNMKRHELQVQKNLMRAENQQVWEQSVYERSRRVRIGPRSLCPVCGKHLGKHMFAVYPNGTTVHFACRKNKNVCPVTGKDFSKIY